MKNFFKKLLSFIEQYIPMTFGNLILFGFLIYLIVVVSQSVISNYNSNKDIDVEAAKLIALEDEITNLGNANSYYQTASFKEKEAREKLGYKAPGENVLSLPIDAQEDKQADSGLAEAKVTEPNYVLWWQYFTKN